MVRGASTSEPQIRPLEAPRPDHEQKYPRVSSYCISGMSADIYAVVQPSQYVEKSCGTTAAPPRALEHEVLLNK